MSLWEIPKEYPALSDHELIPLRWDEIDVGLSQQNTGRATGWDIQGLIDDKDQLQKAHQQWIAKSHDRPLLLSSCTCLELDQEVKWIENTLTAILDTYSKIMRVTSYSKRWWNKEVAEARKIWAKEKKTWGQTTSDREKLKQSRNKFYRVGRKAKKECLQNFLEGEEENQDQTKI